jgi:hypothetical protein
MDTIKIIIIADPCPVPLNKGSDNFTIRTDASDFRISTTL